MDPFKRLQNSRRYPPGNEWRILKRLPATFLVGTGLLLLAYVLVGVGLLNPDPKQALLVQYSLLGAMLVHWMGVIGVGFYCLIVWIMKGPAYVMDPYYLPEQTADHRKNDSRSDRSIE